MCGRGELSTVNVKVAKYILNVIAWEDQGWNLLIRWNSIVEVWDSGLIKLIKLLCNRMEHFCNSWQY